MLKKENILIKTAFTTALILTVSTMIFAQSNRYTFDERQRQLDSLELLQQEAIRRGGDTDFIAEMRQLQAIIKTEAEMNRREQRSEQTPSAPKSGTTTASDFIENLLNSFMGRPVIDKLIIGMGALAVLAAAFLIFTRLFLAILQKSKKRPPKKQILPKNRKQETKQPPLPPAPPPVSTPAPTLENAIYTMRELASKYPSPPNTSAPKTIEPQEQTSSVRVEELLRIDLPTQTAEPNKIETTQAFEIPAKTETPQVFEVPAQIDTPPIFQEQPKVETPPPPPPPPSPNPPRAQDVKSEIVQRFDANEDIGKIAQDLKVSKDQVAMILRLAGRKS